MPRCNYLAILLVAFSAGLSPAQPLNHARDLNYNFSSETIGRGAVSVQGFGVSTSDIFQTYLGAAVGLGRFFDVTAAYTNVSSDPATAVSFGFKIGDPPFLRHHFGIMPSLTLPLADDRAALFGLRLIHILEPRLLTQPTRLYLNYGYYSQDAPETETAFSHYDYAVLGVGLKLAFTRTMLIVEAEGQAYVDADAASLAESRIKMSAGVRLPFLNDATLSLMAGYDLASDDPATLYQPPENAFRFAIGLTRVFFPKPNNIDRLKQNLVEQTDLRSDQKILAEIRLREQLAERELEALKSMMKNGQ